jgi:hypothetical protein
MLNDAGTVLAISRKSKEASMRNWILAVALIAMTFTRLLLSGILVGTLALGLGQAQTPASAPAHNSTSGVLYAAAGAELTQYYVDAEGASLVKRSSIRLPANVQYAWPHPLRKYFYVAWSDGGASTAAPLPKVNANFKLDHYPQSARA